MQDVLLLLGVAMKDLGCNAWRSILGCVNVLRATWGNSTRHGMHGCIGSYMKGGENNAKLVLSKLLYPPSQGNREANAHLHTEDEL